MVIVKNQEPFLKKTISFSELVKAVRVTLYRKWNTPAVFRNIPKSVGNFVMTVEQEQVVYGPECGNRCSAPPEKVQASAIRQNTESVCQNRRRVRPGYPNGVHSLTCKVQKTESHLFSKPRCPKEYSACRHGFRPAVPHACFRPVRAHKAAIPRAEPRFPL